uniref:hypothetical protein n=1 Tax=Aquimonas sp. TaxID=1872588 RepID=UPI0037BEE122
MQKQSNAKTLLASLPIIAQALARQRQVEVVFSDGHPAATDGRRIYMPTLPIPVSDEQNDALEKLACYAYGYLDHEIGHVIATDFSVFDEAAHFGLLNALEDPRQEGELIARYPGTRRTLDALSCQLIADDTQGVDASQAPADLISSTGHAWLRAMLRDEPAYQPIADQGMALIEETLGAGVRTRLLGLLADQGLSMRSTLDAVDLTNAIVEMLKDEEAKAQQPPESQHDNAPQDDGQSGTDPQGDCSGDEPDSEGDAEQGPQGDASQDGEAGQGAQGPQGLSDAQKAALAAAISGDGAQGFRDRGDQVLSQIETASDVIEKSGPYRYTGAASITPGGADQGTVPIAGGPLDSELADRVSASLRQRLNVLLEAKSRAPIKVRDRGHRISNRHLVNLAVQDPRVFEHRGTVRKVDAAVMLIEDTSSSMSGAPIEIANGALYAACKALESHRGIQTAAMAFPGNGMVKTFEQPLIACTHRFGLRASGGTPLYEALLSGARQLMLRREPRKMI